MAGWPALPYEDWRPTRDTLHMCTQVVGKLRLALSPFEPEWAHVALHVTARGLATPPMWVGTHSIDAELDLVDHVLVMRSSDGRVERRPLGGAVADFYRDVMDALGRLDAEVKITTMPQEVADPIPFPDDTTHATYDAAQAAQFHEVLSTVDAVFREYHAGFRGRTTPVHFFWGTFDLAVARFSGRPAQPRPGAGVIERVGGDAEEICAGWWPGDPRSSYPAFYSYGYPAQPGLEGAAIRPPVAGWNETLGEFLLPYEAAREQPDPRRAVLDFLESTYTAAAEALAWDPALTSVAAPST